MVERCWTNQRPGITHLLHIKTDANINTLHRLSVCLPHVYLSSRRKKNKRVFVGRRFQAFPVSNRFEAFVSDHIYARARTHTNTQVSDRTSLGPHTSSLCIIGHLHDALPSAICAVLALKRFVIRHQQLIEPTARCTPNTRVAAAAR